MKFDDEMMDLYLKDINRIPLLTAEEEKKLAVEARNGSKSAKNKLVNANLRFVVAIAKTYQGRGFELMCQKDTNLFLMLSGGFVRASRKQFTTEAVQFVCR